MTDLVESVIAAAAEAIRDRTPALTVCWVERRGVHRQKGA